MHVVTLPPFIKCHISWYGTEVCTHVHSMSTVTCSSAVNTCSASYCATREHTNGPSDTREAVAEDGSEAGRTNGTAKLHGSVTDTHQKHVCYNGPVEIQKDLSKEDECVTDTGVYAGTQGSCKQKWRADEQTNGTYHRVYARVPTS
jgi:hypothetical protein